MNEPSGFRIEDGERLVLSTNPFRFQYRDAVFFQEAAEKAVKTPLEPCYARNSVLLFVLAMEALINRVLDRHIRMDFPAFLREKFLDLPLDMKWYMAPLWCSGDTKPSTYEIDKEPFQSFRELIKIRNWYVHAKPERKPMKVISAQRGIVDYTDLNNLTWPQTKIPKDLNPFDKKCASKAKQVVDEMISLLDQFLGGKIKKDDWWLTETIDKHPQKSTQA
ncbi:MAG: hypothetical protein AMJ91_03900 [candidate division Zixibacteria bacterium SM23_73_3]|nr:MAG: hypothetical protein AMJ91_03900 [candidate division Zixibacteria bacterium SM23_73_3]